MDFLRDLDEFFGLDARVMEEEGLLLRRKDAKRGLEPDGLVILGDFGRSCPWRGGVFEKKRAIF